MSRNRRARRTRPLAVPAKAPVAVVHARVWSALIWSQHRLLGLAAAHVVLDWVRYTQGPFAEEAAKEEFLASMWRWLGYTTGPAR